VDDLPFVFERDHRAGISGPPRGGRDAVVSDENRRRPGGGHHGVERFAARFEPFVEHLGLEQRSREVREDKTRIRFTRPEPAAQGRQHNLVGRAPERGRREISGRINRAGETCSICKERTSSITLSERELNEPRKMSLRLAGSPEREKRPELGTAATKVKHYLKEAL
jgi:hypothetical protein